MERRRLRFIAVLIAITTVVGVASFAAVVRPWESKPTCSAAIQHREWSVARRWDEALLDAIRRALPNPAVHARNLYHLSAAMWDAWATYDPTADGVFFVEKHTASDVTAARNEAISYAAYRVLTSRYLKAVGGADSLSEFADVMDSLCYPLDVTTTAGDSPAAIGNRIAKTDHGDRAERRLQPGERLRGARLRAGQPARWLSRSRGRRCSTPTAGSPSQLAHMISQNGIPIENGVQQAIAPHWGHVTSFALPAAGADGVPIDPGPPPLLGTATDQAYKDAAVAIIRYSSALDPDVGRDHRHLARRLRRERPGHERRTRPRRQPGDGRSHTHRMWSTTGDFARALTEFWADGPKSETPPGHWNVIANSVSDELDPDLRIAGSGPRVDRLQWDVKLYLALNGAVHDAAIAAWGLKGHYDSVRPISMIRYLGGLGQSSDPSGAAYDPEGLPLVPGLIEVVTARRRPPGPPCRPGRTRGGDRDPRLAGQSGRPEDARPSGVGWILAVDWVPYQVPTFVTPSFPGYVSGHSTFSRAAAEVLTGFTGSEYFPGGSSSWTTPAGALKVEAGPTADVTLEWATYYDAADQAGISRLYGGIHIPADDFTGRMLGSQCGLEAWALAEKYYDGSATP